MNINRREMLQLLAAAGAAAAAPNGIQQAFAVPSVVAYQGETIVTVKKVVEALGGMKSFVGKGSRVVIKPNLGFAVPPQRASNTSPEVIRTLAILALEAGAKSVEVLDNPVHPIIACNLRNGIKNALKDLDQVHVALIDDDKFFTEVDLPNARQMKKCKVMRAILECDALINAPMAKSHGSALISMSLKNWMGASRSRGKWHGDYDLHQAIADFATFIKPKFTILDASRALLTGGPGGPGEIKILNTIIGGMDQVAIDSFGVTLAPWNGRILKPEDVPHIRLAAEMGVGSMKVSGMGV